MMMMMMMCYKEMVCAKFHPNH
jgi:hypothetical protein